MKKIKTGKVIIAGDSHQNLKFLNDILKKEKTFDYFVHLGDHFDCFEGIDNIEYFPIKDSCDWINHKLNDDRIYMVSW